ncbi:predicted protein, partial [Nematostella vectensis]
MSKEESLARDLGSRSPGRVALESSMVLCVQLVAVSGNAIVLLVIYKRPVIRTVTNTYIGALAICDLLMALAVMPWTAGSLISGGWMFGVSVCRLQGFLILLLAWTSLHIMALTAVNRYFRVVRPNLYRKYFTIRSSINMIIVSMVTTIVVIATPLFAGWSSFVFRPGKATCFMTFDKSHGIAQHGYVIVNCVIYTFGPMILIYSCYFCVFMSVRNHVISINPSLHSILGVVPGAALTVREVRVTRAVFAMVLGFTWCWIPVTTIELLHVLTHGNLPREGYLCFIYFAFISNAINPVICISVNQTFRRELFAVL